MGSISSRPKVPTTPQVVFVPQSTPTPTSTSTSASTNTNADTSADTPATASEARESNLLRRSRGRSGTVLTGFRGLLGTANNSQAKKTLLGE